MLAQLFYSSDIWPSYHVRNGNVSSYCGANDNLVFGLSSIYNTRTPSINSRSLLTNIFNLTSSSSTETTLTTTPHTNIINSSSSNEQTQITTPHTNIINSTSSNSSSEPTQMTTPQSPVLTDVTSINSGPTTPDHPCDAKCLEEIESDVTRELRIIDYVNDNKLLFLLILGDGIRNFKENINIPDMVNISPHSYILH